MLDAESFIQDLEDIAIARFVDQLPDVRPVSSLTHSVALQQDVIPSKEGLFVAFAGFKETATETSNTSTFTLQYVAIGFFKSLRKVTDSIDQAGAYNVMLRAWSAIKGYQTDAMPMAFTTQGLTSNLSAFPGWYVYELSFATQLTIRPT